MEDNAIRGIRWALLGYGTTRVTSLATRLVIARLLVPSDFGIIAFDSLLIAGLLHFATLGLASSVVVRQDLSKEDLGTALAMMIGVHAACAGALAAASPVASNLLGEPDAGSVLVALSVTVLLGGVPSFYWAVMQRELQFRARFVCETASVLVFAAVSIPLAASGIGVWSLVIGQITSFIVHAVLVVVLVRFHVTPAFERARARVLWSSGRGFVLQGGFSFLEQNADYAVIGAVAGPRQLGLYSMAYRISELPYDAIVGPVSSATFPGFARMRNRSADVVDPFLRLLQFVTVGALPLGMIAAGAARPLVETFLGHEWIGMVGMLQILGLWGSLRVVQGTIGWFVNSIGSSTAVGLAYAAMLIVSIPLVVLAAHLGGAKAVAWIMVGNAFVMTVIVATIAHMHGVAVGRQWKSVRSSVFGSSAGWLASIALARASTGMSPAVSTIASLAAGTAAYLGTILVLEPGLPREALASLRRVRGPERA